MSFFSSDVDAQLLCDVKETGRNKGEGVKQPDEARDEREYVLLVVGSTLKLGCS